MEIAFLSQAIEDLEYWRQKDDKRVLKRIRALLEDIQKHPFSGIGKPEPLKGEKGKWSRRINEKHRMVYCISSGRIYVYVFSLRFHYSK